jgi:hypothetical protein
MLVDNFYGRCFLVLHYTLLVIATFIIRLKKIGHIVAILVK